MIGRRQAATELASWWRAAVRSRVVAAGMIVAFVVVGALCGLLMVGRGAQADTQGRAQASEEAAGLGRLVTLVLAPQNQVEANTLTASTAVRGALSAGDPGARTNQLAALFQLGSVTVLPGSRVAILDGAGTELYTDECGARIALSFCTGQPGPHLGASAPSAALAIAEGTRGACASSATRPGPAAVTAGCPAGYGGLEAIGGALPAIDVAEPVWDSGGRFLGVVVVSTTVQAAFHRLGPALPDPPAVILAGPPASLARYQAGSSGAMPGSAIPPSLTSRVARGAATIDERYAAGSGGSVDGSFVAVDGPDGKVAGYIGVEVATATAASLAAADQRTIAGIGLSVLVLVFLVLATVANLAPRLGPAAGTGTGGAGRAREPAPGARAEPVAPAPGHDAGWARLVADAGIVQRVLVDAVSALGGPGSRVSLFAATGDALEEAACPPGSGLAALGRGEIRQVLAGRRVRREPNESDPPLLLVPAFVDGAVRGAVAVWSESELGDTEALAVTALAGSHVTAMERMRLS